MRVLLVSSSYWPFLEMGGPPVKVRAIAEGLVARGHEVTVLTANLEPGSPQGRRMVDGVDVRYLRVVARYRNVPLAVGARRYVREHLDWFDVAQIFGLYDLLGPTVARGLRHRGIPYAVEPIGMFTPIIRSQMKKRLFHMALGTRLLWHAGAVIATADQERDELIAGGVEAVKIVVRRNGLDLGPFDHLPAPGVFRVAKGIEPDEPITLYLGRLATKKRPDVLLEAFAMAGAPGRLVFIGPDEDGFAERLPELARVHGIADRVLVTGPIYDQRDKLAALVDATVFALPSENENFGNSVAEALACGVPVVVTDRCGIAPFVEGRSGLVVGLETQAFARALGAILGDDALRTRYANEARAVAASLSWDAPLDENEALLGRLVDDADAVAC